MKIQQIELENGPCDIVSNWALDKGFKNENLIKMTM